MDILKRRNSYFDWSIKTIFSAIVFAVICTLFSFHWFVKTDFWQSNFNLPMHIRLKISHNGSDINSALKFNKSQADISIASYQVNKEYKYDKYIKITAPPFYSTYNFNLEANEKNDIKIFTKDFFNGSIDVKSFKINGKEYANENIIKNQDYEIKAEPGNIFNISIICKPADVTKAALWEQISVGALAVTLLFYFFVFMYCFGQISRTGTKELIKKLKEIIKNNKVAIILLLVFVAFYSAENLYTILHLNQCNWIGNGDSPYYINQVLGNTTKRFHPYFFLPFYSLFDVLILATRHIFLSIGLIYILLASLSIMFLYKALDIIMPQRRMLSVILSCIYGFSWAQIHLSHAFDLYMITGFYLCCLVYLVARELKQKEYNYANLSLIVVVSALTLGVTIQNSITAFLLVLAIFITKKKAKVILTSIAAFVLLVAIFTQFKSLTCNNMAWEHLFYKNTKSDLTTWVEPNVKVFIKETLRQPIISQYDNKKIYKNTAKIFSTLFFTLVLLTFILLFFKSNNTSVYHKRVFGASLTALVYNLVANLFWCPTQGLLFSLNHLALWFILIGCSIHIIPEYLKSQKAKNAFIYSITVLLFAFLVIELILNHHINSKRHQVLLKDSPITYNVLEIRK